MVNGLTRTATEIDEESLDSGGMMGYVFIGGRLGEKERKNQVKSSRTPSQNDVFVQIHVL